MFTFNTAHLKFDATKSHQLVVQSANKTNLLMRARLISRLSVPKYRRDIKWPTFCINQSDNAQKSRAIQSEISNELPSLVAVFLSNDALYAKL